MRSSSFLVVLLSVGIVGSLLSVPASAMTIYSVTQDITVFSDDFEGLGSSVSHAAYPDSSGDFDPTGGAPGSWSTISEEFPENIQVTDYATPGVVQGSNYLRLVGGDFSPVTYLMQDFAPQNIGEVWRGTQMMHVPAFDSGHIVPFDWEGAGWNSRVVVWAKTAGEVGYYGGGGYVPIPGLTYTPDKWQEWELTYEGGASAGTLTIDGVGEAGNVPARVAGPVAFAYLSPEATTIYLDAPATQADIPGDLNGDGFVGGDDLDIVRSFWGQSVTAGNKLKGDPSGDGFVGGDDLDEVRANWGEGTPPAAPVPEPSLLVLLAGAALAGLARRR